MAKADHPWNQLERESETQYAQFLTYRNLGPTRNINLAYRKYLQVLDADAAGEKRAPGYFREISARNCWRERAQAWDIFNLTLYGQRVAPNYVAMLEAMARKGAMAAQKHKPGQREWADVLRSAEIVGRLLEPVRAEGMPQGFEPTEETHADPERAAAAIERRPLSEAERLVSVE